jgi:hypothetical protein
MEGSSTSASREADREAATVRLENGGGRAGVPRDRRTFGQTNTLLEQGVDLERPSAISASTTRPFAVPLSRNHPIYSARGL